MKAPLMWYNLSRMGRTIIEYTEEKRRIAEAMADRIASQVNPERILLFGSVARGDARETSDVDLIVVEESDLTFKQRMNFLYSEIERHEDVDMFWYTPRELEKMQPQSSFVRRALEEAVVLYERER